MSDDNNNNETKNNMNNEMTNILRNLFDQVRVASEQRRRVRISDDNKNDEDDESKSSSSSSTESDNVSNAELDETIEWRVLLELVTAHKNLCRSFLNLSENNFS